MDAASSGPPGEALSSHLSWGYMGLQAASRGDALWDPSVSIGGASVQMSSWQGILPSSKFFSACSQE